ncbi:hypothetical protein RhiLY_08210 [Ceratobasidium sp. AG-Ba]|nr:hypothetical protein RhiLY_08210 [Ceratobasidium sp. AG-Ba]
MDSSLENLKGKIILHGHITAKEGQAERLQGLAKDIHDYALAGNEPGCLAHKLCRNGNDFLVFEEFASVEAVKAESPPFQAFLSEIEGGALSTGVSELLTSKRAYFILGLQPPQMAFYEEV